MRAAAHWPGRRGWREEEEARARDGTRKKRKSEIKTLARVRTHGRCGREQQIAAWQGVERPRASVQGSVQIFRPRFVSGLLHIVRCLDTPSVSPDLEEQKLQQDPTRDQTRKPRAASCFGSADSAGSKVSATTSSRAPLTPDALTGGGARARQAARRRSCIVAVFGLEKGDSTQSYLLRYILMDSKIAVTAN